MNRKNRHPSQATKTTRTATLRTLVLEELGELDVSAVPPPCVCICSVCVCARPSAQAS